MITNVFFNNYQNSQEQNTLEDLIIESIKIYGIDCYYVTRTVNNFDKVFETDDQSSYVNAYLIEVYLKNIFGFSGDKEFMSKFAGLEMRDQIIFTMSIRAFANDIGNDLNLLRPREGDLLFFPFPNDQRCFQIKFVNRDEVFYQLGGLYTWELTCELFEYSDEVFNTGIPMIDRIQLSSSTNIRDYSIKDVDGAPLKFENGDYWVVDSYNIQTIDPIADNDEIHKRSANTVSWTDVDPFSDTGQTDKSF